MLRTFKFKRLDDMAFFLFDPGFSKGPESPFSAMPSKVRKWFTKTGYRYVRKILEVCTGKIVNIYRDLRFLGSRNSENIELLPTDAQILSDHVSSAPKLSPPRPRQSLFYCTCTCQETGDS